ncbi:hypothetical protein CC78DRAFT_530503 [Lojkania enalia]|uniref:Jacalin-type lectin domain-containing protein n=1 Tax=Lojkania enalia TaxID=147567 RepID=A0A9P4KHF6_9PLEO|nr:hypothetical protein CC78DRAFT_530503 [Didymosphaeria enalia]
MRFFSPQALLIGASLLPSLALAADMKDCEGGPWGNWLEVGNTSTDEEDKNNICETLWSKGVVINGVEAWGSKDRVEAIQFYFTDGSSSKQLGEPGGASSQKLTWDPAQETVTQVKMWGNGKASGLGKILMKTSGGGSLEVGRSPSDSQTTFEPDLYTGILLGALVYVNDEDKDVGRLGLLFLRSKIKAITINEMQFQDTPEALNEKHKGLQNILLEEGDHINTNDSKGTWVFGNEVSKKVTKKLTNQATHTFGWHYDIEAKAQVLGIGFRLETGIKYEYQNMKAEENGEETEIKLKWEIRQELDPNQKVFCRATVLNGEYKGAYNGKVALELEDGYNYEFWSAGEYEQIAYGTVKSKCQSTEMPPFSDDPTEDDPAAKRSIQFPRRAILEAN